MPVSIIEAGENAVPAAVLAQPQPQATPAASPATAPKPLLRNGTTTMLTDAKGRQIGVRALTLVDELKLTRMLGGTNSAFMWFCLKLAHVTEISGDPVSMPTSEVTFEVLAQRLGYDGMRAINAHLEAEATLEALRAEEHRAAVGN